MHRVLSKRSSPSMDRRSLANGGGPEASIHRTTSVGEQKTLLPVSDLSALDTLALARTAVVQALNRSRDWRLRDPEIPNNLNKSIWDSNTTTCHPLRMRIVEARAQLCNQPPGLLGEPLALLVSL